jgi:nicotinamidase-related amidase
MIPTLIALLINGLLVTQPSASGPGEQNVKSSALLVIDIQNFYFPGGAIPLAGSEEASFKAKRLLEAFRARGWPVIHVRHLPKDIPLDGQGLADSQYSFHKNVAPLPGEKVVGKHYANSFRDTELNAYLIKQGIHRIIVCGMQTHMCVEAAVRAAADLGFDLTVVEDACATRDLKYGDTEISARLVHAAVLAALQGTYALVVNTDEMLKSLDD